MIVPKEPSSFSPSPDRLELKELLLQFRSFDDKDTFGVTGKADDYDTEPVPLFDLFILVCIVINGASSCMDHFTGVPVLVTSSDLPGLGFRV
jgi:hypothetical protein